MARLSLGEFARSAALTTVLATSAQSANADLYQFTLTGSASSFGSLLQNRPATVLPSYFNIGDDVTIRFVLDTDRNTDIYPTLSFAGGFSSIISSNIAAQSFTASNETPSSGLTVDQTEQTNYQAIGFGSTMDRTTHPANLTELSFQFNLVDSNGMQDGQSFFSSPNQLISAQNNFASLAAATSSTLQISLFGGGRAEYVDFTNIGYTISQITPVPEPTPAALLGTGLLALGAAARKQKKSGEAPAPVAA